MKKPSLISVTLKTDRDISWQAVKRLYTSVGWWAERGEQNIQALLKNSVSVGAWSNGELVGFARAVTDGCCRAYLEDVVVLPERQGRGIGSALVDTLLTELADIDVISLFCDSSLAKFYKQFGFEPTSQRVLHLKQKG